MIKFGIKLGLASGALYYISEQGVWKDSDHTAKLCNQICTTVSPYTQQIKNQFSYELPSLPQTNELSYLAKHYWNKGVINTFGFLANIPAYVNELAEMGTNALMNNEEVANLFASTVDAGEQKNVNQ